MHLPGRNMPRRTRSHVLEDHSRNRLREVFVQEGWTVEDLDKDYGEDMFVRIFEGGNTTPFSFFVQAKATDNLQKYRRRHPEDLAFRVERGHVRHWMLFAEPVFLTIFDAASNKTYWVCVQDALHDAKSPNAGSIKKKTVLVTIPLRNLLNEDGVTRMKGITKLRFGRLDRRHEAIDLLLDIVKSKGIHVTIFDPDGGLLSIKNDDGGSEDFYFGDLRELITELQGKLNLSTDELLRRALHGTFEAMQRGELHAKTVAEEMWEDRVSRERAAANRKF